MTIDWELNSDAYRPEGVYDQDDLSNKQPGLAYCKIGAGAATLRRAIEYIVSGLLRFAGITPEVRLRQLTGAHLPGEPEPEASLSFGAFVDGAQLIIDVSPCITAYEGGDNSEGTRGADGPKAALGNLLAGFGKPVAVDALPNFWTRSELNEQLTDPVGPALEAGAGKTLFHVSKHWTAEKYPGGSTFTRILLDGGFSVFGRETIMDGGVAKPGWRLR